MASRMSCSCYCLVILCAIQWLHASPSHSSSLPLSSSARSTLLLPVYDFPLYDFSLNFPEQSHVSSEMLEKGIHKTTKKDSSPTKNPQSIYNSSHSSTTTIPLWISIKDVRIRERTKVTRQRTKMGECNLYLIYTGLWLKVAVAFLQFRR